VSGQSAASSYVPTRFARSSCGVLRALAFFDLVPLRQSGHLVVGQLADDVMDGPFKRSAFFKGADTRSSTVARTRLPSR